MEDMNRWSALLSQYNPVSRTEDRREQNGTWIDLIIFWNIIFDSPKEVKWNGKREAEKCACEENQTNWFLFDRRDKLAIAFEEVAEDKNEESAGAEQMRPNIAGLVVVLEDCLQTSLKINILSPAPKQFL